MNCLYSSSRGPFLFVTVGYRTPGPSPPRLSCSKALLMLLFIFYPPGSDAEAGAEHLYRRASVRHVRLRLTEEEDRHVQKGGHGLNGPVHASDFEAVENVRSDTCAFMGCAAVLYELQILSRPLSEKRRAKR